MNDRELSYYTSGWIRLISLYVQMTKAKNEKKKNFTPALTIGNAPRKY